MRYMVYAFNTLSPSNYKGNSSRKSNINRHRRDPDIHKCMVCHRYHPLRLCRKFLQMNSKMRNHMVDIHNYCVNCLARSHDLQACQSLDTCRRCSLYHHTLLHPSNHKAKQPQKITTQQLRNRQKQRAKTQQPKQRGSNQQLQSAVIPDTKIIYEAIRSLAQVLCGSEPNSTVA